MTVPNIRSGFPVVATSAAATPPYNNLTPAFSASEGDELTAIAIGAGLPTVTSRNSGDTAAGTLVWVLRFVVRQDYKNTSLNAAGAYQVAFYTAVVPSGGVTERALYATTTVANDGGGTVTGTVPARLMVVAVDNTNGIGAVAWKGSIATNANSNDITTGQQATQTIKPFGNSSLLLSAGWFTNGTAPTAAAGCTEVVAPGTDRMPLYSKTGGTAGLPTALGSSITDSTLWALGVIEYLPTDQPKPSRKILVLGDSGMESTHSTYQVPVSVQDNLAPHFEIFGQGVWYAHLAQMKSRWDAEKATLPAMDVAIVQCGGNDLTDGGNVWTGTMETALQAVYDDLETAGIPIAAGTMFGPDVGAGAPAGWYDMRDWITANVPAGTHLYSHQIVSDPATNYLSMITAYQAADGSHVNEAGNRIFGANISAWIESLNLAASVSVTGSATAGNGAPEEYIFKLDASPGTTTVTVTPTSGVAGSWSPSTLALTSANWDTGLPSNYTASATGSGNISSTDDGGLTNDTLAITVHPVARPSAVTAGTYTDEAGGALTVSDLNDASDATGARDAAGADYSALLFDFAVVKTSGAQVCKFRGRDIAPGKQWRVVLYANDGTTVVATGAWHNMTTTLTTYTDNLTLTGDAYKGQIQKQAAY